MKKLTALFLALVMVISVLPAGLVFAAELPEITEEGIMANHGADVVIPGETIIHFKEAKGQGTWNGTESARNYDGGNHRWANSTEDGLQFSLANIGEGNYEIFYYVIYHSSNAKQMNFTIDHNGKQSETFVYTNGNGITESHWASLGVFDFSGKSSDKEKATFINTIGGNVRASGLKYVLVDREPTNPGAARLEAARAAEEEAKRKEEERLSKMIYANPYPGFSYEGGWNFSSTIPGPMVYAQAGLWIANGQETDTCTYKPDIKAVGKVRIGVYLLWWHENQVKDVKYEVHLGDGTVKEFHLDPRNGVSESQWVNLGEFDFDGSGTEFVKLVCVPQDNDKANTRASTVRFEIINDTDGGIWQTVYVTPDGSADLERAEALTKGLVSFADMENHWAGYDVSVMATKEMVQGVAEGKYDPESTITRAQFVTILDRAMKYELVSEDSFADVPADSWYYTYVATANKNGLLKDLPVADGFKPDAPITREEMALLIYNAIQAIGKNDEWLEDLPDNYDNFADSSSVSEWAKTALRYLIRTGIIKGTSDTTVSPEQTATRAQAAVILKRFMEGFVWSGPSSDEEWVLTFNDEFEYEGVNWDVWQASAAAPGHIESSRWPENIAVYDGAMHLLTKNEEKGGKMWTTGDTWVNPNVFRQAYGYWEARYKYTESGGINNAFWMITIGKGYNFASHSDHRFEIDINEGHYPNKINNTYHTANDGSISEKTEVAFDLSADYHTYAVKWDRDFLYYYFDGELTSKKPNLNAIDVVFPIFSTAVLNWAGTLGPKADGSSMDVEYVRIYQRKEDAENKDITKINDPLPKAEVVVDPFPKITTEMQVPDNQTYPGEVIIKPELIGNWQTSTAMRHPDNSVHHYTNTEGSSAKYSLKDLKPGKYRVLVWRLPHSLNVKQMNYMLVRDGEETYVGSVALQPGFDDAKEAWVEIAPEFEVTGNKDDYIIYTFKLEGVNARACWFKFVPIK